MRTCNLALDSAPLGGDIFTALDYSGLELHGLEHSPLHRSLLDAHVSADGRSLNLSLRPRAWDDGQTIHAREYLRGLNELLRRQKTLAHYLKGCLRSARAPAPDRVELNFHRPLHAAAQLLMLPNWVPFRPGYTSGAFRILKTEGGWTLLSRGHASGQIRLVASPEENRHLFAAGDIDYSADTASLVEEDSSLQRVRDTGLFGCLVYGREPLPEVLRALRLDLQGLKWPSAFANQFPALSVGPAPSSAGTREAISIGYDDFYPNRQICRVVAAHLRQAGWEVEIRLDDYYRPRTKASLKFMILRGFARNSLGHTLLLRHFPRAAEARVGIARLLQQVEGGACFHFASLAQLGLGYPLFRVLSRHRARFIEPNPLLEVFH